MGQPLDAAYINPKFGGETHYRFVRFGSSAQYYARFMLNNNNTSYGNGGDFSIFTYDNRGISLRPGTGHVILIPTSAYSGNVGIEKLYPEERLDVNGGIRIVSGSGCKADYIVTKPDPRIGSTKNIKGKNYPFANVDLGHLVIQPRTSALRDIIFINGQGDKISMVVMGNIKTRIGTTTPDSKLSVIGNIRTHEIKLETASWPDYVFDRGYQQMPLEEMEVYIRKNGHLPGLKCAEEFQEEGVNMMEMNQQLLGKIVELTLHLIKKGKQLRNIEDKLSRISERLSELNP
ncbi:hypothetical protein DN752_01445 [Echinicola strongylocentroti]|uniref:Peptidase S74 domain-containing protein n=1 Tax=Echinicola strongylocentroti TaxID=1795355 RepID=A0A2Z4ID07_9BACT|nr:hypothetical protein [Echinicola strongylocentroti]AWW28901.1 hypothetical protein DN752_01445 [Echinicola strongylocentroti]